MPKIILTLLLFVLSSAQANNTEPELAHWLPSLHHNLYDYADRLEQEGLDRPELIQNANRDALIQLRKVKSIAESKMRQFITRPEAELLLRQLKSDPVASPAGGQVYDPDGKLGFCFGRATWVWLQAMRMGVDKNSIKKLFLVGPMDADGRMWQFHVATAIRGRTSALEGSKYVWYVIDSDFNHVKTADKFFEFFAKTSTDSKLRLFISDPQRLGASNTLKFGPVHYNNPYNEIGYNLFFRDMLLNLKNGNNFDRPNLCKILF